MGARVEMFGQEHIEVEGVGGLAGTRHRAIADNLEALTWLIGAVMTGGDVEIRSFPFRDLEVPLIHLRESGARLFRSDDTLIVRGGHCYPVEISTGPYPGINSDMQPLFAVYGACARGESRVVDLRFPGRYGYVAELARMGVRCAVDGNVLTIHGGAPLRAAEVTALDLRAGVALTLAGLAAADGPTVVADAWQVERGYNDFVGKLCSLGGRIGRA
jgi:UDP-N-acetylglucosamine 1-carboxyvinyltransferase